MTRRKTPSASKEPDLAWREPFSSATLAWFDQAFPQGATRVQSEGWPRLAEGKNALMLAPTGSGKTLAAFLWAIDQVHRLPEDAPTGVRILYVSPLKALVYDIERNLRSPLVGIERAAQRLAEQSPTEAVRSPRIDVRTGDTPARDRRRQVKEPGEIMVTTPESLYLLLSSQAAQTLTTVHTVIIDEIHSIAGSKRGVHLALSLERLCELVTRHQQAERERQEKAGEVVTVSVLEPQRIGLSATVDPPTEAARFLGGDRAVEIVDASEPAHIDLTVTVPIADMENPPHAGAKSLLPGFDGEVPGADEEQQGPREGGLWPSIYPELLAQIECHRSTIVFTNSRGLCERLSQRLNELWRAKLGLDDDGNGDESEEPAGDLVRAHHGSVSHEKRAEIEEGLKSGALRAIVATSSLELGIDMGAVDLVILVESPGSVASGLQRVGRAGHQVGETSQGVVFPKYRGDLLEAAVVAEGMKAGQIEPLQVPNNALDVLAQQIVAICCDGKRSVDELFALVRRSYPYRELTSEVFTSVLDMLSGRFPSEELADLRPRINWDRGRNLLEARAGAPMLVRFNAGTIPDRGLYSVHLGDDGPRLGELDEEMVHESRPGDTFYLGASTWRVEDITRDRVIVSPAPGQPARMPFWRGEGPGRPIDLGRLLGEFSRRVGRRSPERATAWLEENSALDEFAIQNLVRYLQDQKEHNRNSAHRSLDHHRALSRRAGRLADIDSDPIRSASSCSLGDGARGPALGTGRLRGSDSLHRRRHRAAPARRR